MSRVKATLGHLMCGKRKSDRIIGSIQKCEVYVYCHSPLFFTLQNLSKQGNTQMKWQTGKVPKN